MSFIPSVELTFINGFLFMIPLFLIRFGVPYLLNPQSLPKLQYFPDVIGKEKAALRIYFITNTFLIFSPLINPIVLESKTFLIGICIYIVGILFFLASIMNFVHKDGFVKKGIYKISRNPMYIGYFAIFLGTAFIINSLLHIILTIIYQCSVHFLILSEERWCKEQYGQEYIRYFNDVPRYFLFF